MYSNFLVRAPSSSFWDNSNSSIPFNQLLNDRYRILKLLGQGGFGKTFLAADEQQGATSLCVVKQLVWAGNSIVRPKASELFHREARHLARLGEHPQIPKFQDAFEQCEQAFIVQEWIDGWTLEQEVAGGVPFDRVEIWKVLREILPVLQYCHDRQIVHRDLKPSNIIRRRKDRQLVLVDFGAAKHLEEVGSIYTGTLIGSAEYAAPEQIRGYATFASDLYSLGVICLHLLTQMSPFDLYDVSEDKWKWQTYLTQPIDSSLEQILCKLLQPATRRRYHSATEVLADLDVFSLLNDNPPKVLGSAVAPNYPDFQKQLSVDLDFPSTSTATINITQTGFPTSSAVADLPETEGWYRLTSRTEASAFAGKVSIFLRLRLVATPASHIRKDPPPSIRNKAGSRSILLGQRLFTATTKNSIELVFSVMSIFILTCIGSMSMICFFFEMDRRSHPTQVRNQSSLLSSPTIRVK